MRVDANRFASHAAAQRDDLAILRLNHGLLQHGLHRADEALHVAVHMRIEVGFEVVDGRRVRRLKGLALARA